MVFTDAWSHQEVSEHQNNTVSQSEKGHFNKSIIWDILEAASTEPRSVQMSFWMVQSMHILSPAEQEPWTLCTSQQPLRNQVAAILPLYGVS